MSYDETIKMAKNRFNGLDPRREMIRLKDVQFFVRACGLKTVGSHNQKFVQNILSSASGPSTEQKNDQIIGIQSDGQSTHDTADWNKIYMEQSGENASPLIFAGIWNRTKNSAIDILKRGEAPYKAIKAKVADVDNTFVVKDSNTIYLPVGEMVFSSLEKGHSKELFVDLQVFHRSNNMGYVRYPNSKRIATATDVNGFGNPRGLRLNYTGMTADEFSKFKNVINLSAHDNWDNITLSKSVLTALVNELNNLAKQNILNHVIELKTESHIKMGQLTDRELDFSAFDNDERNMN